MDAGISKMANEKQTSAILTYQQLEELAVDVAKRINWFKKPMEIGRTYANNEIYINHGPFGNRAFRISQNDRGELSVMWYISASDEVKQHMNPEDRGMVENLRNNAKAPTADAVLVAIESMRARYNEIAAAINVAARKGSAAARKASANESALNSYQKELRAEAGCLGTSSHFMREHGSGDVKPSNIGEVNLEISIPHEKLGDILAVLGPVKEPDLTKMSRDKSYQAWITERIAQENEGELATACTNE